MPVYIDKLYDGRFAVFSNSAKILFSGSEEECNKWIQINILEIEKYKAERFGILDRAFGRLR